MPSVEEHYEQVLADVYSWMYGGWDAALARNNAFFTQHGVRPLASGIAVDLGAGCGFQSIPLAALGFAVTAIDVDRKLLDELREHTEGANIRVVRDDLLNFRAHTSAAAELVVCMVDTLVHLETKTSVLGLIADVHAALQDGGRFIITFRDLSRPATELERFIPVRSDEQTIFTCFLEYEPETVKVHHLVYRKEQAGWKFYKSFYRKLRLSQAWVTEQLERAGFSRVDASAERGFVTVLATR
jgi:protein-L-isoaspartate O-methyltransferase